MARVPDRCPCGCDAPPLSPWRLDMVLRGFALLWLLVALLLAGSSIR